jgi:hypothetical protein
MSLFQTKLVLNGIADTRSLEAISIALGEYDRKVVSSSLGTNESDEWLSPHGYNESVSYQTQRQRVLTPGEIAKLPPWAGAAAAGRRLGADRADQVV